MKCVAIIDTSLMCCWLRVPGYETAGSDPDLWNYERTNDEIKQAIKDGYNLVFPFTTLLETGNHIANARSNRFEKAQELAELLHQAADGDTPWINFADQFETIRDAGLEQIVEDWPSSAARGISLGDCLITAIADYYSLAGFEIRILSSDQQLRQHHPQLPPKRPRRRG